MKTYASLHPSRYIQPRLYGYLKALKLKENYPMKADLSTIGTPPYHMEFQKI